MMLDCSTLHIKIQARPHLFRTLGLKTKSTMYSDVQGYGMLMLHSGILHVKPHNMSPILLYQSLLLETYRRMLVGTFSADPAHRVQRRLRATGACDRSLPSATKSIMIVGSHSKRLYSNSVEPTKLMVW